MPKSESARRAVSQIDASLSFVHLTNIERYKKLLATDLGDNVRMFVQSRLAEEEASLRQLNKRTGL
jgi:hypothetical protein